MFSHTFIVEPQNCRSLLYTETKKKKNKKQHLSYYWIMMFLLWNKWLPSVTKHINRYNSRSYLDHLCDEYFGGLTSLCKFHCLYHRKTSIW